MLTSTYAGLSDLGRQRSRNDDRWGSDPAQGLYIVADGVGSTTHGDVAAAMAVEQLPAYVGRHFAGVDLGDGEVAARFGRAVVEMCTDLHARSLTDEQLAGAGTTLVTAIVGDSRAVIAHLGDSRAYLHRDGQVKRLTSDHTIVQAVLDAGEITEEEAAHHPKRSVVTRHVLMSPPAKPDVNVLELQAGDRILLCSDGLSGVVDDSTLAAILSDHPDPADACRVLIQAANDGGGPDNITAVVVDAGQAPTVAAAPPPPATAQPTMPAPMLPRPAAPPPVAGQVPPLPPGPPPPQPLPPRPPAGGVPPHLGAPPARPPLPPRRRGLKLALVALVVVLLAGAGVGFLLWHSASQPKTAQTAKPAAQPPAPSAKPLSPNPSPAQAAPIQLPFSGLDHVKGVAVDGKGNVYVLAVKGDRTVVLKLSTGQPSPTELPINGLGDAYGIAVDGSGRNVYITDRVHDGRLMRWIEGSNDVGELALYTSDEYKLKRPSGVAVDAKGDIYVADTDHNRVLKVPADSTTESASPMSLPFTDLRDPVGVAVDAQGDVFVLDHSKTDQGKNRLLKLPAGSNSPELVTGAGLDSATGVAADAVGNVYLTDRADHEVLKVSAGSHSAPAKLPVSGLGRPNGVAVDTNGNIYVTDDQTPKVVQLPAS